MIDIIGRNKDDLGINAGLDSFRFSPCHPSLVLSALFLKQLHLPAVEWDYDPTQSNKLIIQEPELAIQMNEVWIRQVESRDFVYPEQSYTYFLLTSFLQVSKPLVSIYQIPDKKSRFLFGLMSFETHLNQRPIQRNSILGFLKGFKGKKRLEDAHESFFVLLDDKLTTRMKNALVAYETRAGEKIDRSAWLAYCTDAERLKQLKLYSEKLIREL